MYTQAVLLSVLAAIAEARFGQEQIPIPAISAVTSGGGPGVAATLAGGSVSLLLAAANPCAKLQQADQIIAQLGTGADAIAAAKGLVAAEQNFNPSAVSIPSICSDPTLPATEVLRGIVPLVDPAVGGSDVENANSAASIDTPFASDGLSVADIMAANGFTNFTTKALDGTVGQAPAGGAAPAPVEEPAAEAPAETAAPVVESPDAGIPAGCPNTLVTVTRVVAAPTAAPEAEAPPAEEPAEENPADDGADEADEDANNGGDDGADEEANNGGNDGADGGADNGGGNGGAAGGAFGICDPTIRFEGGLGGRPATEFTFQSNEPQIEAVQQEALNPNIITNRICDSLVNICGASDAGIATCEAAQATILASGARDASVVAAWSAALGL